jgi:demethylmenaquinone methyltransferase / 2-methoxy-6-polyprenyl-1,4-benzoquinol methylase
MKGPARISHRSAVMSNREDRRGAARTQAHLADSARLPLMRAFFNRSARHYNMVNLVVSLGTGAWYRRFCLRRSGIAPGALVVDIATGTGLVAREALALRALVVGVDVSEAMLAIARRNLGIPLIQAAAEALPLAAGIADFVTMGYALRHVADLEAAFAEAYRTLRPGGRLMLLEVSAPRHPLLRALAGFFIGALVPRLSWLLARDADARNLMNYHWETILTSLPPEAVMPLMRAAGFRNVTCISHLDLFHHYTGQKPDREA